MASDASASAWIRYLLEGNEGDQEGSTTTLDRDTSPFSAALGGLLPDDADFMIDPRNSALVIFDEGEMLGMIRGPRH